LGDLSQGLSCHWFIYIRSLTWVWKYNEESRLQIVAFSDCANIWSRATFHARPNSPFTRPWSAQSCSTDVGVDQKGGERIARIWEKGSPDELDKEFDSPNALNVTKTSRLRYADHMIKRPVKPITKSSIQSQTQWKEKSRKTEIQVDGWGEQR
jgi:hypothetical protein